jgi:hypothetical protein
MNYNNNTHQIINNIIMMARPTYKYISEFEEMTNNCEENNYDDLPFYRAFSIWIKEDKELFKQEVMHSLKHVNTEFHKHVFYYNKYIS